MDELEHLRERRRQADAMTFTPNCPNCLEPMTATGDSWVCERDRE